MTMESWAAHGAVLTVVVAMVIDKLRDLKKEFDFTVRYTVAEAAACYRRSHGRTVKLRLCGQTAYATSDAEILHHIMGAARSKYLLRPGQVFGLKMIGMLNQGIIWNQDLMKFKENRPCFERCLNSNALSRGCELALDVGRRWCATFTDEWKEVDMMDAVGELTVRIALPLFFGINPDDLGGELQELRDAIKGYFEAWEFFLLKPSLFYVFDRLRATICGQESQKREAELKVARVRWCVDKLLARVTVQQQESETAPKALPFWLELLSTMSLADRRQMCIELLLASADTSSVTLYYTLVLLAQKADLKEALIEEIQAVKVLDEASLHRFSKMDAVLKESMRLKPVGPMILRTAVEDDEIFIGGRKVVVPEGTHFILNIRDFHMDEEYFPSPREIRLDRYKDKEQAKLFQAFGSGPKSCVGKHFAMLEMKALLSQVLLNLEFKTSSDLATMETRWDIANHPTRPEAFQVRLMQ